MGIWWGLPQQTSEAHRSRLRCLQVALQASLSIAWSCTQYAISDGEGAATIGCSGGFAAAGVAAAGRGHTYGMRKHGEFGIFFVIL